MRCLGCGYPLRAFATSMNDVDVAGANQTILGRLGRRIRTASASFKVDTTPRLLVLAAIVGLGAGLGAVVLIEAVDFVAELTSNVAGDGDRSLWIFLLLPTGLWLAWYITFRLAPEAAGHGIPQIIGSIVARSGKIRLRVAPLKTAATAFDVGSRWVCRSRGTDCPHRCRHRLTVGPPSQPQRKHGPKSDRRGGGSRNQRNLQCSDRRDALRNGGDSGELLWRPHERDSGCVGHWRCRVSRHRWRRTGVQCPGVSALIAMGVGSVRPPRRCRGWRRIPLPQAARILGNQTGPDESLDQAVDHWSGDRCGRVLPGRRYWAPVKNS